MTRILWIVGLSIALFFWGGLTVGMVLSAISHRHITFRETLVLAAYSGIAWLIFQYLRIKIGERKPVLIPPVDSN